MYRIDPDDLRLAREFKANPFGIHSPDLLRLLRLFRGEAVAGKHALLCTKPNREWMLVQLSGEKGEPIVLHKDKVFHDLAAAEWAVFKLRWKKHTGHELPID